MQGATAIGEPVVTVFPHPARARNKLRQLCTHSPIGSSVGWETEVRRRYERR